MAEKKKKILLIEDDQPTIEIYETVLRHAGFEVENAPTGREALEKIDKIREKEGVRPDLVLLDLILPDVNGTEILKVLKGEGPLKTIPTFVLTNYTDPKLEKEIWKTGAEKFLVKTNCIPSQLVNIINKWFENPEK